MKTFNMIAEAIGGRGVQREWFSVEADSVPEAAYDGKKLVTRWLERNHLTPASLIRFDITSVRVH